MLMPRCQIAALASLFFVDLATNLASAVSLPANPLNSTAPLLECRRDEPYGKGLDDQSCGNAWSQIPQDDRLKTWAVRGTGVAYKYWLPRLFASRTCSI